MYIIYVLWWSIYVFLCVSGQSEQTTTWLAFYFIQFFLLVGLAFFFQFFVFFVYIFFCFGKKKLRHLQKISRCEICAVFFFKISYLVLRFAGSFASYYFLHVSHAFHMIFVAHTCLPRLWPTVFEQKCMHISTVVGIC